MEVRGTEKRFQLLCTSQDIKVNCLLDQNKWRRRWHTTPVLLPGKSHGRGSLVSCSPWGRKEADMTEQLHFHFSLSCIGEGNGNLLQCSCLENPRDWGAWWAAVYGVTQSRTQLKRLGSSSSSSMALLQPSLSWHFSWQHSQNLLSAQTIRVFYVQLMDSCCLLTSHFPRATFSEPPGWGGPLA